MVITGVLSDAEPRYRRRWLSSESANHLFARRLPELAAHATSVTNGQKLGQITGPERRLPPWLRPSRGHFKFVRS